jgi:hypothetical protein
MADPPHPDPPATGADRPVARIRTVDLVVSLVLLALAALLGADSWRIGSSWASDGPQAGYFPFYLSLIMALASLYGILTSVLGGRSERSTFVTAEQLGRVMKVFVPIVIFCLLTQFLGLYFASFLLVGGFMWRMGLIRPAVSLLTAAIFTGALFLVFEIAFNVIMPKGPLEAALGY